MSLFSDWGAADEYEELEAAKSQALTWLSSVASAKGWSSFYKGSVETFINQAATAADGWFSDDVTGFYQGIVDRMDGVADAWVASGTPLPTNWDKLRNTYASAAGAAERTLEGRQAGSVATVVSGTVEGAVEDVKTAVNPAKSLIPWIVGAVGLWALTR